jgi:ribosomal protein L34
MKTRNGRTALKMAEEKGRTEIARLLKDAGARE